MQKPSGYDEAQTSQEFTPVTPGGHYCTIKQVTEMQSSTGRDMVVVLLDFCKPDPQAGCFTAQYENDIREQKKWPFPGTKYIMINDYNDQSKTSRQFKTFCTCFEKSNGCSIKWGTENWAQQFKGKKIGAVYGEEENEYEGRTFMRTVAKWFCTVDAVKDAPVPQVKYLPNKPAEEKKPAEDPGWMNVPEGMEKEIPF